MDPQRIAVFCCLCTLALARSTALASGSEIGACGAPASFLHEIQGSGLSSPLRGVEGVVVEAVVVASFPGLSAGLGGFFLQEEDADADGDASTSEGLFVFHSGDGEDVRLGDTVRIRGTVREFFGLTEIGSVTSLILCEASGGASAVPIRLPVGEERDWERWDGMSVRIDQPLVATDVFDLGRFGEVELAAGGRLFQPTQRAAPGAEALAWRERNARHRTLLDDGSSARQPPLPHHATTRAGDILRVGDRTDRVEGVVHFAFGRYRIQPTRLVDFERTRPRPQRPPELPAGLRIAAWNVANHFNGDGRGGGFPTRGAGTPFELERQREKLVETLVVLDADLLALVELENDGVGPGSALGQLADALSRRSAHAPYAVVDPGRARLGSQAISVGLLYRPSRVLPLGVVAVLDSAAHSGFDSQRNRPSLARSFRDRATGEPLTLIVNHFKSKGSSCDAAGDPDRGDGQGECNQTRTHAAASLADWLRSDPTQVWEQVGKLPSLVLGDLNAYPEEDPIAALEAAGYADLLAELDEADAHSFVFDGAAGRLDHALASPSLLPFVAGAGIWHTSADESPLFDYSEDNPPALYRADPVRASDHDPIVVSLFRDSDGDGATDARDRCPHAGPSQGPLLEGCHPAVADAVGADGCPLSERVLAILDEGANARRAARRAAHLLSESVAAGQLTRSELEAVLGCIEVAAGPPRTKSYKARSVGIHQTKRAPPSGEGSARRSPPPRRAIDRAIASPSP